MIKESNVGSEHLSAANDAILMGVGAIGLWTMYVVYRLATDF